MNLLEVLDMTGVVLQDALEACGFPTDLSRYIGVPPADDCCDDMRGQLVVWWDALEPARQARPGAGAVPCPLPLVRITAQWLRCWPTGTANADGTFSIPTLAVQEAVQQVTEVVACGWCALRAETCGAGRIAATCRGVTLERAVPVRPSAGCVGVRWSLLAAMACN